MNNKVDLEKLILQRKPEICELCGGKMFYMGSGTYQCEDCHNIVMDDFGKVKAFLEENGASPAVVISESTGVPLDIINIYLRTGRLEIPEGSKYFINCERCGCSIRYGRFCPECAKILAGGIKAVFNADVGEKPKIKPKSDMAGQMHFINRKK